MLVYQIFFVRLPVIYQQIFLRPLKRNEKTIPHLIFGALYRHGFNAARGAHLPDTVAADPRRRFQDPEAGVAHEAAGPAVAKGLVGHVPAVVEGAHAAHLSALDAGGAREHLRNN